MGNHNMKFLCNLFGYYIENVKPYYICVIIKICIYFKEYRGLSYYPFLFIIAQKKKKRVIIILAIVRLYKSTR